MNKIIPTFIALLLFVAPSCVRRTTIPDGELSQIFMEAFLANAYVLNEKVEFDTLQVYQPIFDKYGYSVQDVAYTIGSFSKRKSARLSDVVEQSIKLLEQGANLYKQEALILDSIDAIASRAATRRIYYDPLVEFHSMSDTVDLKIVFDSLAAGNYNISFTYKVDSLDDNKSSYRAMTWLQPNEGTVKKSLTTTYLRKRVDEKYTRTVKFDTMVYNFTLQLAESFEVKRKPHVTFKDITLEYTPHTADAVQEYYRNKLDIRIFADEFFPLFQPTDSL